MNVFQIMSEPIRRRIIEILASGEHTSGELIDAIQCEFGVTPSAVSHHLAILRTDEWVAVRAEWTNRLYRLDESGLERMRDAVYHLEQLWERRIGVIARHDPELEHALPIAPRRRARLEPGAAKGLRGAGRRDDPWQVRGD